MAAVTAESHGVPDRHYYHADNGTFEVEEILTSGGISTQNKQISNDDECWLFKPMKTTGQAAFTSNSSCLLWAREVFDSPTSEFYHRRHDLLNRLEVILATEPAKRLPYLGGSVPALNTPSANISSSSFAKSHAIGGGSGQNFGPGSNATFVRPKRHASEMLIQNSSPIDNRSPAPLKTCSGSTDDLQNVADLQSIARKQEDELKAEVAAISAHHQASRMSGSQQSLNSTNRSGPESPYNSQARLNISSSATPSDIAKQQMAALRLSLDSQRHTPATYRDGGSEENLIGGGEVSPGLQSNRDQAQSSSTDNFLPLGAQQAVIVGRPMEKVASRLPTPMRRGPRFPSAETLPSFGWGDGLHRTGKMRRSSQEQLTARRIPMPPPRSGSSLSNAGFKQQ